MPSDERAHFLNITDLSETGRLRKMGRDEHYEAIQPPFYYACMAAVSTVVFPDVDSSTRVVILRYLNLALYMVSTAFVLMLFARDLPNVFNVSVCACYALSPTLLGICCTVTNDALSFMLTALTFLMYTNLGLESGANYRRLAELGLICGFGMLTKLTFAPVVITIAVSVLLQQQSFRTRIFRMICLGLPICLIFIPWLGWNLITYGALQPYGSEAKWLVRGTFDLSNAHAFLPFVSAFAGYHLSPSEFWLNQFHLPLAFRILSVFMIVCSFVGGLGFVTGTVSRNKLSRVAMMSYVPLIGFWFTLSVCVNWEPVRGFLAGYFGFVYLMVLGSEKIMSRFSKLAPLFLVDVFFPMSFLTLDLYLIIFRIPYLQGWYPRYWPN